MKTIKTMIAITVLTVGLLASCKSESAKTVPTARAPQTEALLRHLKSQASRGYMFGQHDATLYGIGWKGEEGRSDVKSVCGDYPAVVSFDLGHIEDGALYNLDGVSFDTIRQEIINHYQRGGVVSISWHANNPFTGGTAWDVTDTSAVASILPGGLHAEKFQIWLSRVASFLNSLRTADGVKIPVIFRPWHEHTGSWFWWGQGLCTTEQYKVLWKLTVQKLTDEGVDNVLLAYSPGGDATDFMERYPGDELIDVLGFDSYQYNGEQGEQVFVNALQRNLQLLDKYCHEHDKIYAVTEVGYEGIPNTQWWTKVLDNTLKPFHPCYVLVWRNAYEKEEHYFAPYPGQISEADFKAFYQLPSTLFLKDIENMYE